MVALSDRLYRITHSDISMTSAAEVYVICLFLDYISRIQDKNVYETRVEAVKNKYRVSREEREIICEMVL